MIEARRLASWIMTTAIFFALFPVIRIGTAFITLSDLLFVLAMGVSVLSGRFRMVRSKPWFEWVIGTALISVGLAISSILNGDPGRGLVVILQYMFAYIFLPVLLMQMSVTHYSRFLKSYLAGIGLVSLGAVWMYYARPSLPFHYLVGGRIGSFLENPNEFGKMIALSIPLWGIAWETRLAGRLLLFVVLIGFFGGLLVASSFGALLAVGVALGSYALLRKKPSVVIWVAAAAAIVGINYLLGGGEQGIFSRRIMSALSSGDPTSAGSLVDRVYLLRESWGIIQQSPLIGLGADMFQTRSALQTPTHNIYALLWVEGGLGALLGWMTVIASAVAVGISEWRKSADYGDAATLLSVVATFAASAFSNNHVYARYWLIPIYLALFRNWARKGEASRQGRSYSS